MMEKNHQISLMLLHKPRNPEERTILVKVLTAYLLVVLFGILEIKNLKLATMALSPPRPVSPGAGAERRPGLERIIVSSYKHIDGRFVAFFTGFRGSRFSVFTAQRVTPPCLSPPSSRIMTEFHLGSIHIIQHTQFKEKWIKQWKVTYKRRCHEDKIY